MHFRNVTPFCKIKCTLATSGGLASSEALLPFSYFLALVSEPVIFALLSFRKLEYDFFGFFFLLNALVHNILLADVALLST